MLPAGLVQTSCGKCHEVVHGLKGAEVAARGADLFMARGCYGCHDVKGMRYLPKFSPPLNDLKAKLVEPQRWVAAWVKDPAALRKETLMPDFHLSEDEVANIAAFLLSLGEGKPFPEPQLAGASAEEGKKLFTDRGCRGCHAVEPDERSVSPGVPHLGDIGSKVKAAWLDRWIANPKELYPDAAMPKIELTEGERHAIVAYLLTLKRAEPLPPPPGGGNPEKGKELVKNYECYGCHAIPGFEQARPSVPDLGEFARKPIDELDFGNVRDLPRTKWDWLRRKLKEPRAYETEKIKLKMPTMRLADDEIDALITFVLALDKPALPTRYAVAASPPLASLREASWMIVRHHCNGCHPIEGQEPRIARFFERTSRVAPTLDGVGARLQGQYLYQFLLEPKQVRPWLTMRMPTFGFNQEQARWLTEGLAAKAQVTNPYTYVAKSNIDPGHYDRGFLRFRHYKCIQCHPSSLEQGLPADIDPDDLSINLMLAKERLRPEWLAEFLARPKQIAGVQTRMPTVFYTVDGVPKVERPEDDIRDIVTYLMGMKEAPEVTLKAFEEKEKAEREKEQVDWTTYQY
jgi:mono/diheme cytochrome c family protein